MRPNMHFISRNLQDVRATPAYCVKRSLLGSAGCQGHTLERPRIVRGFMRANLVAHVYVRNTCFPGGLISFNHRDCVLELLPQTS